MTNSFAYSVYELETTDLWCNSYTAGQNTGNNAIVFASLCKVMVGIFDYNGKKRRH